VIVVNSFSKTYNMTGWRLGWALASEPTIRQMYKAAEFTTSNAAAMVQRAGIVALREGEPYVRELLDHYAGRRAQVKAALDQLSRVSLLEPEGAFYAFFQVDGVTDTTEFTTRLLRETGLALTPGEAFGDGGEGFIRLCFAASEQTVRDALVRLTRFMKSSA
jgi:aspartate/methionine/tyrosine aminotransferase